VTVDTAIPGAVILAYIGPVNNSRPVILLVHGAWHGAWVWTKVQSDLIARGWQAETVELPSTADHDQPRAGLYDDAEVVRARINQIDAPVVIGAHSYGGAVVTQAAADMPNVRHILYICATQLDVGESLLGVMGGELPTWWIRESDTVVATDPRNHFYHDVSQAEADRAVARLKPLSWMAVTQPLTAAAWHSVPSTYIVCDLDTEMVPVQLFWSTRATHVRTLHSSHSPFLSMPAALVDLIVEAAERDACSEH
jgi:pimeloyl-ACP methyl ester carboxylesterase